MDIVDILSAQAREIADKDIPGWGNTMREAVREIEFLRGRLGAQSGNAQDAKEPCKCRDYGYGVFPKKYCSRCGHILRL